MPALRHPAVPFELWSIHVSSHDAEPIGTFSFTAVRPLDPDQRWSSWSSLERLQRGPEPRPAWLVTSGESIETELGVLKTGKEADVHLVERASPDGAMSTVLAAKRYRPPERRSFHRHAGYTEGRRIKDSREARAVERKTAFGRQVAAGVWAQAEWSTLVDLWTEGAPVPYPVQIDGLEILMELVVDEWREPAPRLANARPSPVQLTDWFDQLRSALIQLSRMGIAHGDLSAYNVLVGAERLVIIDVPQVVDLVANPHALDFLHRDCVNVCTWFERKGLDCDAEQLFAELLAYVY